MSFSLFINFNGNCREAVDFYARVFRSEVVGQMTFGQMPQRPDFPLEESDKEKILYAGVTIFGTNIMFSDVPSGVPFIQGNTFSPTLGTTDMNEVKRIFAELKEGGQVEMELQKTFWSDCFGMVVDKFGIRWQLSLEHSN